MTVESCRHGGSDKKDVVLTVLVAPGTRIRQMREGLRTVLEQRYKGVEVTEITERGVLEVRVCKTTASITRSTEKILMDLLRGQGVQVLQ